MPFPSPALTPFRSRIIESNRAEYAGCYSALRFPTDAEAAEAMERRRRLLDELAPRVTVGCRNTKLDCASLAPGCVACAEGVWSCLFISGQCNCRCFYCPAPQDDADAPPTTNTVEFPRAEDYVDYVERFGFRGVSLSGGEPLLALDTTLKYLTALKRRFADRVHLWLYTNGTLATPEILGRLRDAGLDEIRFDIGATAFRLDHARLAVGAIPTVTVEIPAVPDQFDTLRRAMEEMAHIGVRHLNLHQLRLTPHNARRLLPRNYVYLHGEHITVLESELTALRLIRHALDARLPLPVNYCSMVYKHRFQRAAARRRSAGVVTKPTETVTDTGHIRALTLAGKAEDVAAQIERFRQAGAPEGSWAAAGKERVNFHPRLWPLVDFAPFRLSVAYFEPRILPALTYRHVFAEVPLNRKRTLYVEKIPAAEPLEIQGPDIIAYESMHITQPSGGAPPADARWEQIRSFESLPEGLQDYF